MRFIALALSIAAFLFVLPSDFGGERSDAATVEVVTPGGHGSGVYLGHGYVLTAGHVAKDAATLGVKDRNGNQSPATVLWYDANADVGLLVLNAPLAGVKAAPLACTKHNADIGDRIEVIGYPMLMGRVHTFGRIATDVEAREKGQTNVIADITIAPGNSGGPVFDADGNIAGIVVAMAAMPTNPMTGDYTLLPFTYIIPRSVICQELQAKHEAPVYAKGPPT
jgi:serine protease Do